MSEESGQRLNRTREALAGAGVDFYLATHAADIRWLTDFSNVFDDEPAHLALIVGGGGAGGLGGAGVVGDGDGKAAGCGAKSIASTSVQTHCLFTDTRYSEALHKLNTQAHWRILDERRSRFAYVAEVLAALWSEQVVSSKKPVVIGIESDLRLDWFRALAKALDEIAGLNYELRELSGAILQLRAIKSVREIELLKGAQAITDAAFAHLLNFIKPGLTEKEVALELEIFIRRAGVRQLAFPSIVASGPNSAVPHAVPGNRVLQQGDAVLLDFGASLNDYCSDMTRTVFLGKANERQHKMYAAVAAAQQAAFESLRSGVEGCVPQRVAEDVIAQHGFAGKFIHSLGHGVGIEVHELPTIAPQITEQLVVGQVLTVEPGIYLEGVCGVRIEDFGLITAEGFESFSGSTKELIEL